MGHASKLGYRSTQGDNWTLSIARCQAVRNYLQEKFFRLFTPQFSAVQIGVAEGDGEFHRPGVVMGVGDTQSGGDSTNDRNHGFFRAVEVKLYAQGTPKWKDPVPLRHGYTTVAANRFEFEAVEYPQTPVSGLGDEAYFDGEHALHVRKGKVRFYLNLDPVDSAPATEKHLRDLASRVSGRL